MTRARLYDVYFLIGAKWVFQIRTFFPFTVSEQKVRGNIAKNLPVHQRMFSGKDTKTLIRDAYKKGFSSGYWRLVASILTWERCP